MKAIITARKSKKTSSQTSKIVKTKSPMQVHARACLLNVLLCLNLSVVGFVPSARGLEPAIIAFPVSKANIKVANQMF